MDNVAMLNRHLQMLLELHSKLYIALLPVVTVLWLLNSRGVSISAQLCE